MYLLPRMNDMLDFIDFCSVELRGTKSKRKLRNENFLSTTEFESTAPSFWNKRFIHTASYEFMRVRFLKCYKYVYL